MKRMPLVATAMAIVLLAGCSSMSNTQQRVLSGGAIGAGSGAVITALRGGCIWCGAAIGGAVGAGAGYVISQSHGAIFSQGHALRIQGRSPRHWTAGCDRAQPLHRSGPRLYGSQRFQVDNLY